MPESDGNITEIISWKYCNYYTYKKKRVENYFFIFFK